VSFCSILLFLFESQVVNHESKGWKSEARQYSISLPKLSISEYFLPIFQQLYSHIASAIIPVTSIIAVPSAAQHFPQQKVHGNEEWGPLASSLLRASFTSQMLIPTPPMTPLNQYDDDDEDVYQHSKKRTTIGRIDASTDER
jgi:hypothetical protein